MKVRVAKILIGLALLSLTSAPVSAQAVRRNIRTPDAERMLASYVRAIEVMRRLPADDPHNWSFQANLHGYPAGTPNPSPLWGQCQHGQWWFLPWHRAYLHAFEKIIRVHSGDPTFAIPYWDWSEPAGRTMPAAFRNPASLLFDRTRRPAVNSGSDALDDSVVVGDLNYAMSRPAFFSVSLNDAPTSFGGFGVAQPGHFHSGGGALELSPHNYIHGWIGGNMQDPDRAASDPIFFLHHANIDRLWEVWLAGAGRQNPLGEPVWLNQRFTLYDENKRPFTIAVRDMLNTRAQLNYVYADPTTQAGRLSPDKSRVPHFPAGLRTTPPVQIVLEPQKPWGELKLSPMQIELRLDERQAAPLKRLAKKDKLAKAELVLMIEGITYETACADSVLEVYLNLPSSASPSSVKRRYLADRSAFFGSVKNQTAHFRLGEAFERLRAQVGFRPEALTITLSRHWFGDVAPANSKAVTFKNASLVVEQ